jgi:hypothetical protein
MRTYTHKLKMDTIAGPEAEVLVTFDADKPFGPEPTIHGLLSLYSSSALNDEDMQKLFEWLLQDKEEWV